MGNEVEETTVKDDQAVIDSIIEAVFEKIMMYPVDQITRAIGLFEGVEELLKQSKDWKENGEKWGKQLSNSVWVPEKGAHYLDKDFENNTISKPGYDRRGSIELIDGELVLTLTVGGITQSPVGDVPNKVTIEELVTKGDSFMASAVMGHVQPGKLRAKLRLWQDAVQQSVGEDKETGEAVFVPVGMKSRKFEDINVAVAQALPQKEAFTTASEYKMSFVNEFHDVSVTSRVSVLFSTRRTAPSTGVRKSHSVLDIFIQHVFKPKA